MQHYVFFHLLEEKFCGVETAICCKLLQVFHCLLKFGLSIYFPVYVAQALFQTSLPFFLFFCCSSSIRLGEVLPQCFLPFSHHSETELKHCLTFPVIPELYNCIFVVFLTKKCIVENPISFFLHQNLVVLLKKYCMKVVRKGIYCVFNFDTWSQFYICVCSFNAGIGIFPTVIVHIHFFIRILESSVINCWIKFSSLDLASVYPKSLVDLFIVLRILWTSAIKIVLSFLVVCNPICFLSFQNKFCLNFCFSLSVPESVQSATTTSLIFDTLKIIYLPFVDVFKMLISGANPFARSSIPSQKVVSGEI